MTILMPTTTAFMSSNFFLETLTQTFESPVTRKQQVLELSGQRWRGTWTLPAMSKADAADWIAFFLKLKGQVNTFTASDPDWQTNLGAWSGIPLVKGAGQTGNTLLIDGCDTSVANWAKAADYFKCNGKLYRCISAKDSDVAGEVTLEFEPPIYNAPADNAPITFNPATIEMRLLNDGQGEWNSGFGYVYEGKTFSAVEAL